MYIILKSYNFIDFLNIDFFFFSASVKIFVERPVKINLKAEMVDSTVSFIQCFKSELKSINLKLHDENECVSLETENATDLSQNWNLLKYVKNINLYSTQIVLELVPSLENNAQKLICTVGDLSMETAIETFKGKYIYFLFTLKLFFTKLQETI